MVEANPDEGLKRLVGIRGLTLNIVNNTVGAGIFALPAIVGLKLGSFSVFAYLFCGMMMTTIMLCYAEIGTKITSSGGSYAYVEAAFGDYAGFIVNWLLVFGWSILGDAALMNIVADSLAVVYPVFAAQWARGLLMLVLLAFMVWNNVRGVQQGVGFVKWITIIKLLPLAGIILLGIWQIEPSNLHWEHLPRLDSFGSTILVLFFAFAGFETALAVSGEMYNPRRTVPLGILLGGMIVMLLYLLLQTVTQGVLGTEMEAVRDAPLAGVAERIVGPAGAVILLMAAAISCFGTVGGDMLNAPRVLFAGARDGLFPKFLAKVHPKFATPYLAIITLGAIVFVFSVFGGFEKLAILASAAILIVYILVILSTIKLRMQKQQNGFENTFRVPGGLLIPLIGIGSICWVLTNLAKDEIFSTLGFIAIVSVIFVLMKATRKRTGNLE